MTTTWFDMLEDRFGVRVPETKAHRWERILNAGLDEGGLDAHTSNDELCKMILFLVSKRFSIGERFALTVDVLFGWLKWYRKDRRQQREGYDASDAATSSEAMIAMLKPAVRRAGDNDTRWGVIINPVRYAMTARDSTPDECDVLLSWAEHEGLLPRDYVPQYATSDYLAAVVASMRDECAASEEVPF